MIIGATPETDFQIINGAESLYKKFELKRVFYSAFIHVNEDATSSRQERETVPHCCGNIGLYQADWLLRYYGFEAKELLSEESPNFNVLVDPKCNWALEHLECFPVEVNRADYHMLLRVPGIGYNVGRIVKARRMGTLDFTDLKKMGVVLKRALYFLTCNGKMMYPTKIEEDYILRNLLHVGEKLPLTVEQMNYRQLSLFDDVSFGSERAKQNRVDKVFR